MKNRNHKVQGIQLLSLSLLLVISVLYSSSFTTIIAFGISSSSTTSSTTNTTSSQDAMLIDKGISFYNLGKVNESITYYDKALSIDPNNAAAQSGKEQAFAALDHSK